MTIVGSGRITGCKWRARAPAPHPATLLPQLPHPVQGQAYGGTFTFRLSGYQKAASVGRDLEIRITSRQEKVHRKQSAVVFCLELISLADHINREHLRLSTGEFTKIELLTISAPGGTGSTILRNLPPTVTGGKWGDVNFFAAGFGGTVCQPLAIWRHPEKDNRPLLRLRLHNHERLLFTTGGNCPDGTARGSARLVVNEVFSVRRPLRPTKRDRNGIGVRADQQFILAATIRSPCMNRRSG